jgi:hypothetical protein
VPPGEITAIGLIRNVEQMEVTPDHLLTRVREVDYSRVSGLIRLSHIDPDIIPLPLPIVIRDPSGH